MTKYKLLEIHFDKKTDRLELMGLVEELRQSDTDVNFSLPKRENVEEREGTMSGLSELQTIIHAVFDTVVIEVSVALIFRIIEAWIKRHPGAKPLKVKIVAKDGSVIFVEGFSDNPKEIENMTETITRKLNAD